MNVWQRIGISLGLAVFGAGVYWCVADVYFGQWVAIEARVTGRRFVPDRSHWQTDIHADSKGHITTSTHYVSIPAEYHVFCVEADGTPRDMDDVWGFSNIGNGQRVVLRARVGRSGHRWSTSIDRERSPRSIVADTTP